MNATKFGRHSPTTGHITIEARHGLFSRGRKKTIKLKLVNERWLSETGHDFTDDVERIEELKRIKRLEALCAQRW